MSSLFEQTIERALGRSIEKIRQTPISEWRKQVEKKHGKPMQVKSYFPWIGRGHVL